MHWPQLLVCVSAHWNFFSSFTQLQRPIALYQGNIKCILWEENVYGKYISFATLGSYVACLGAKVFKFPWSVSFGGFSCGGWAETKTGLCSSSDSLVIRKCVTGWNLTFCKISWHFVIVIFQTVFLIWIFSQLLL